MDVEKLEEASNSPKDNILLEYILITINDIIKEMKKRLRAAIAGATGYVGIELVKILYNHPKVKISYLCASKSIGKKISFFDKSLRNKKIPNISNIKKINWNSIDVIFSALPNGEAHKIANIIPSNVKLIDLSGDFRINNPKIYKKWYGIKHLSKNLIKQSKYSISEFSKNKLANYKIISCPGCYPTSIQIPLIPLINKKLINTNNIIIDSKSGYSGAGKNIKKRFKSQNINNSVSAYGVGSHKHMAEIDQELSKASKSKIKVSFTPHLIPMFRGILSTIYLETKGSANAYKIHSFLKKYHKKNFFVKIEKLNKPIGTYEVMNTNYCHISIFQNRKTNKIIIISAIDNLIKGAAGQAVQNMNIAFNLNEKVGLV